ncbi:hybrid sensor histidine kinase/response regulator [Desulfovibrio inopinatus]|uniref:hybrid sensor histidine kinase/response regulator n=1 Tax=Desulfovibrio inopinatus TaxID=102109 RepID=UPI00040F4759|nr:ATP-binding protein [Desulfovibrio inopinatus]
MSEQTLLQENHQFQETPTTEVPRRQRDEDLLCLTTAIEQAGEAFLIIDMNLTIRYVNQTFEEMTGYSSNEVKGRPLQILYRDCGDNETFRQIFDILGQEESWTGRMENIRKDGQSFRCEKTISVIRGKGGVIRGYVGIWRDVTEVENLERQLIQAQKMEALATLAGGIAHDFNNILGPIILYSQLGISQHSEGNPSYEFFEQILNAAHRAQKLVDQLLQLGRKNASETPIVFRVHHIVKECLKLLRPSLPVSIHCVLDLAVKDGYVLAEPAHIHQVIMNLCTNAIQAMRKTGGTLTIRLDALSIESVRNQNSFPVKPGKYLHLTVSDTGHGIPVKIINKIFDPFFTTRSNSQGTGLGLAVANNIVTRLGGAIVANSSSGHGATFDVLLPRLDNPVAQIEQRCAHLEQGENERILLVDYDPCVIDSIRLALECLGYQVTACLHGKEALYIFDSDPTEIDLGLINMTLPEISIEGLTASLLERRPTWPIVFFSRNQEIMSTQRLEALGARAFLAEPFHLEQLAQTIKMGLASKEH